MGGVSSIAITGTDTGVGKTRVGRALLRAALRRGVSVAPLKLVETGCIHKAGELVPEDGVALARAANVELSRVAPLRFELPASPAEAARAVGRTLSFTELALHVEAARALCPSLLLEGAGGALVPFGADGTFADLVARLGLPALIVARDALGTVNHTLLTVEALERRGVAVQGIVLQPVAAEPPGLDHRRQLGELLRAPVFGPLAFRPDADDDALADEIVDAGLDPKELFGA